MKLFAILVFGLALAAALSQDATSMKLVQNKDLIEKKENLLQQIIKQQEEIKEMRELVLTKYNGNLRLYEEIEKTTEENKKEQKLIKERKEAIPKRREGIRQKREYLKKVLAGNDATRKKLNEAKRGYGPGEQDWGFVDVREGAHMFYWLYYTSANVSSYTQRPLAIWLQGGPGASSTGYGNFEELGPLDLYGNNRNWTWVKDMNVLFIDNPVGSGFSYTDSIWQLTSTNNQIALDLVEFMKGFYALHPEFQDVPLHIFCESYGGKMAPEFALELYYAIQRNEIKCNFTSVALGDPWTSPMDSMKAWTPLLLNMGIIDQHGYKNIMASVKKTEELVEAEQWTEATKQYRATQSVLAIESIGVDFYDISKPNRGDIYYIDDRDQMLQNLMRGPVSKALGIPSNVKWGSQKRTTFSQQAGDFMKPVIHIVSKLLDKTPLKVGVFSGQFDLICATPGTVNWIEKMRWSYRDEYLAAPRLDISVDRILEGYEKSAGNFTMFWVNRAGHMVPADNPAAMSHILKKFTNYG